MIGAFSQDNGGNKKIVASWIIKREINSRTVATVQ
jgi:hypothetical protein